MHIRTIAITLALAAGLGVILFLAFIMCIPAYIMNLQFARPRSASPAVPL